MISYGEPSNPKFKYTKRPQSSKVLLHFKRDDDIKLENPSTLNKREWNKKFNLTKLRTFWTQKGKVSFDITDRKFPSTLLPKEVQDEIAKKNKPLFRKDYLPQSEQQFHNKLFNINHGIAIDDYVPPNESINFSKKVFEPFSLRSPRWNRNCILDKMEKKELEMKT